MNTSKRVLDKIIFISSKKMLRIEQWRDEHKHWRAGIEWYGDDRFEFICELPTLEKALDAIILYMKKEINN